ncbi:uncharacterized protein LOC109823206 [Asparagus officinalis]|uniref:uncharacterized protein LOC109823206 n=1 Tax=Asparagus officinalis TaxID=4686 RepID=UPI00098E8160|nr:uncharacterized protein LOC109823206 [Asparagus officinalis]
MAGTRGVSNPSSSSVPQPEVHPNQLLAMIQGLATNQQHLARQLQREPQHQPPPRPESSVRQFRYMRPPSFSSAEGPLAAEEFLKVTETILTVTPHRHGSNLVDCRENSSGETHPVGDVHQALQQEIFSSVSSGELLRRFVELKQGGRTVDEYEAEFSSLSRYAPHLVTDPTIRRHQFQKGLDKYIRFALAGRALATHDVVLDAAREVESVHKELEDSHVIQSRTPAVQARNIDRSPSRQQQNPERHQFSQRQPLPHVHPYQRPRVQTHDRPSVQCSYCSFRGHTHQECPKRLRLCFNCRSPDHVNRDYP